MADPQNEITMLGPSFWLDEVAEFMERDPRDFGDLPTLIRNVAGHVRAVQIRYHEKEMKQITAPDSNVIKVLFGD